MGLSPRWAGAGIEAQSQTRGPREGSMEGETRTVTLSAARLPSLRAIASTAGNWLDQVQYCGQPLLLPWSELKQAFVQVYFPSSHLLGHVHLLWAKLGHSEQTEAEQKSKGTAVWEDDLGRGGSQACVPLQAVTPFLSLERQ